MRNSTIVADPQRNLSITFFHPDCTVGCGISPHHAAQLQVTCLTIAPLVGCTTGRE